MSNSQNILLSDNKDLNSTKSFVNFPCRAPIRTSLPHRQPPARNCRIESDSSEDGNRKRRKQPAKDDDDSGAEEKENVYAVGAGRPSELKARRDYVDENDDGFKTPTSLDQKIPASPACPPPPRKPKPPPSMKRRAPRRRVLLDLSNEIELLFPPAILADLGNNVNKIRQAN